MFRSNTIKNIKKSKNRRRPWGREGGKRLVQLDEKYQGGGARVFSVIHQFDNNSINNPITRVLLIIIITFCLPPT